MNAQTQRNIIQQIVATEAQLLDSNKVRDNLVNNNGDTMNILILNGLTLISLIWDGIKVAYMATLEELGTILSGMSHIYQNVI